MGRHVHAPLHSSASSAGRGRGAAAGGGNARPTSPPPRETWHAEPAKVADNLYFLGEKAHHSWAIVGSEGIILIEALYDYMVADEVAGA